MSYVVKLHPMNSAPGDTALAQDWRKAHPGGTYPMGVRRIEVKECLEANKEDAAALAPV